MKKRLNDEAIIDNEKFIQLYEKINPEKKKIYQIFWVIFLLLIFLIITIILIGYLKFHWFQYKQDNITQNFYHQNQIILYKEIKNVYIDIETENNTNKENKFLFHQFLLAINSKKRLNYLGEIDYLYNATIIILQSQMDDINVFGSNYSMDELTEKDLLNPEKTIFSKFSFYENGTLENIYLPKNITKFYGALIIDLIEQIIPRISKKLYMNKINNIEFLYESEKNKSENNIKYLTENHLEKTFYDKYSNISFKGSKALKNIKRTINNDVLETIECKSKIQFSSENKTNEKKDKYLDLGIKSYSMRIISNLNLVRNEINKELNEKIKRITKNMNFIESNKFFSISKNEKDSENSYNYNESLNNNSKSLSLRNLDFFEFERDEYFQMEFIFTLIDFEILSTQFSLKYIIYLSPIDLKLGNKAKIFINEKEISLSLGEIYKLKYKWNKKINKTLIEIPFAIFVVPLNIKLEIGLNYEFTVIFFDFKHENDIVFSSSFQPDIHAWISGELSTNFPVVNLGVKAEGKIIGMKSDFYLTVGYNTSISGNFSIYTGPYSLKAFVELVYLPGGDLYFFKWEKKTIHKELNLKTFRFIEEKHLVNKYFIIPKLKQKETKEEDTKEQDTKIVSKSFYLSSIHNSLFLIIILLCNNIY